MAAFRKDKKDLIAPINRNTKTKELAEGVGHQVLFEPNYSSDANDIERDLSALKRARRYAKTDTFLDDILRGKCASGCLIINPNNYSG